MKKITSVSKESYFDNLPAEYPSGKAFAVLDRLLGKTNGKVVVLDDDPTGTQTVHDINVVTGWTEDILQRQFESPDRCFYILTNSRSLPTGEAVELNREIITSLDQVAVKAGKEFTVISRSDSTLRGHFPAETDAISDLLRECRGTDFQGTILMPAFIEGGRFTIRDIHWVEDDGTLVPAGETEFARDPAFGYQSSDLRVWVEEKTNGKIKTEAVVSIGIDTIRNDGPEGVLDILRQAQKGSVFVANAATYTDVAVLSAAFLQEEAEGRRYLFRTAASMVPLYGGVSLQGPLSPSQIRELKGRAEPNGGVVFVGSHVEKTTAQLKHLLANLEIESIELTVPDLLDEKTREREVLRVTETLNRAIAAGRDSVVYTSRAVVTGADAAEYLRIGETVSDCLVAVLQGVRDKPGFIVSKGGITSSDLATKGLGCKVARVRGQIIPGVSIWETGSESKWPGALYGVFPGNVGDHSALFHVVRLLRGDSET